MVPRGTQIIFGSFVEVPCLALYMQRFRITFFFGDFVRLFFSVLFRFFLFSSQSCCFYPRKKYQKENLLGCQMSSEAQSITTRLHSSGLLRSQGLIGGKWIDAYDGKTIEVWLKGFCVF